MLTLRGHSSLPTRLGGLNIPVVTEEAPTEFPASCKITSAIVVQKAYAYDHNVLEAVLQAKAKDKKEKRNAPEENAEHLCQQLSPSLKRAINLNRERFISWLAALQIEEHGFSQHKSVFHDALCLRYGWKPKFLPTTCICGHPFDIDHALCCSMGAFPIIRHNEI